MSKNLEDIKQDIENNTRKEYEFITEILYEDAVWLIEQAEKTEKYREVLEFYADENSYRKIGFAELYSPAERDFGQKARQALEGEV